MRCPTISRRSSKSTLPISRWASARIREAQEAVTKKKLQTDPRFTALSFNDEQRAELQRVTAPAVAEWKANMAKLGIDGERLYTRARELIQQYKVATK